ncbi:MAG TPA: class I SAM-dependent methyltransferase [Verrucomicrobiae bacterium]|nr:class I SAM-dependent methyltransferase [Verrucomicrobiae bacterium]
MTEPANVSLETETTRLIRTWLREQAALFKPRDPEHVLIANNCFRAEKLYVPEGTVIDLGGGTTLINGVLARLGMKVHVVDFMDDYWTETSGYSDNMRGAFDFLRSQGVHFIKADLTDCDLRQHFPPRSADRIVTNHTLEHFHASPRKLLESSVDVLADGGLMVIEVPNAVNLLKRIKVLCGRTNYPPYEGFYSEARWMGHVREYSVGDLTTLARLLGFDDWKIYGRNWHGALYWKVKSRPVAAFVDRALQLFPGLCGSLFLEAHKRPAKGASGAP